MYVRPKFEEIIIKIFVLMFTSLGLLVWALCCVAVSKEILKLL
jgi:hypothetical protein